MSKERPTVAPELIAALIESTPDRVRSRLDRSPGVAASWEWQRNSEVWSINTGGETVTLPHGHVLAVEQLRCTCLLAPRCFHVLACLTGLQVVIVESKQEEGQNQIEAVLGDDLIEPDEKQLHAARELTSNLSQLLRVGVANAGVVVQSGVLRAAHQCRAEGLHRLGALGLRIISGTSEFRSRATTADPAQLAEDVADALETSRHVCSQKPLASFWIGTARRKQLPVRPRRLHGLFAEPIITRSGFSGAAVYFLGEDDRIYTASELRPGNEQLARDAYLGGIEIGPLIQPAKQLARNLYLGTDLTASQDGRLGRGKDIRIVEQGPSTWQFEGVQQHFRRPLADQWNAIYANASNPAEARSAGWDFVFLEGKVLGAVGPDLLFELITGGQPVRLAIENESRTLFFRENLRMLTYAPGLRLQVIARVNLLQPRIAAPLAVAPITGDLGSDEPRLELPESLAGRICLGFDELQRHSLVNSRPAPFVLNVETMQPEQGDPLGSLRRRWLAAMLSGFVVQRASSANTLAAEIATLDRRGFTTGAALLEALQSAPAGKGFACIDTFLATAIYLRNCSYTLAKTTVTFGD